MVPSLAVGQYHIAGYHYSPYPLFPSKARGKVFGLASTKVTQVAEEIITTTRNWLEYAESAGVDLDHQMINKRTFDCIFSLHPSLKF